MKKMVNLNTNLLVMLSCPISQLITRSSLSLRFTLITFTYSYALYSTNSVSAGRASKKSCRLFSTSGSFHVSKANSMNLRGVALKNKNSTKIIRRWDISSIDKLVFNVDTLYTAVVALPSLEEVIPPLLIYLQKTKEYVENDDELQNAISKTDFYKDFVKLLSQLIEQAGWHPNLYKLYLLIQTDFLGLMKQRPYASTVFNFDRDNKNILNEVWTMENKPQNGYLVQMRFQLFPNMRTPETYAFYLIRRLLLEEEEELEEFKHRTQSLILEDLMMEEKKFDIKRYDWTKKTLIFIHYNKDDYWESDGDSKEYRRVKSSIPIRLKSKSLKESKTAYTYEDSKSNTKFLMPLNPDFVNKKLHALVIKDRNPIGKYKQTPAAKGVVTVFIPGDMLEREDVWQGGNLDTQAYYLFISRLVYNVGYRVTLIVRKHKKNITYRDVWPWVTREGLEKSGGFNCFLSCLYYGLRSHDVHELQTERKYKKKTDHIKIVFKPHKPEDDNENIIVRDKASENSSELSISNTGEESGVGGSLVESKREFRVVRSRKGLTKSESPSFARSQSRCFTTYSSLRGDCKVDSAFSPSVQSEGKSALDGTTSEYLRWRKSLSPSYLRIVDVIKDEKLDFVDKQKQIENIKQDSWKNDVRRILSSKTSLSMDNLSLNMLIKQMKNLDEDLKSLFKTSSFNKNKSYAELIKILDSSVILSIVMSKIIPFTLKFADIDDQPITKLLITIGREINRQSSYELYRRDLESGVISGDIKLNDYIEKNNVMLSEEDLAKLGLDLVSFFSSRSTFVELKEIAVDKETYKRMLLPKDNLNTLIENFAMVDSEELPMLVKPLPWKLKGGKMVEYGGTYSNRQYQYKSLISATHQNPLSREIKLSQDVVDVMNIASSYGFKINNKLLDIITSREYNLKNAEGRALDKLIDFHPHPETSKLSEYIKNKNQDKSGEILTHNSNYIYNSSILNIAFMYRDVGEFYLTPFMDWRGRIYFSACTLNIQGGELARGLLLLSKGRVLTEQGLKVLKIYTANAYGLDKKSKVKRLVWVEQHLQEILDTPHHELWLNAKEPLIFLACALELQGYYQNPEKFLSSLPILLDGTCNGLQHLSAIANDMNLAEKVNICASVDEDEPRDVYSELLIPIKENITKCVENNPEYYALSKLKLTRKVIKRGIMTITYGVTVKGILNQLEKEFFVKPNIVNGHYTYIAKDSSWCDVSLSKKELFKLSEIIYRVLFDTHPILEEIMVYFQSIAKLLNILGLPIIWTTPSGLVLQQRYSKFTKYDITSVIQSKRRKITLQKPELDDKNEIKINTIKQINSLVPNFIHSMDASNIILLIKKINEKYGFEVLTIHDCFGVNANFVGVLSQKLKEAFISIYGDKNCINDFHKYVITNIKAIYGKDVIYDKSCKNWYVLLNDEKHFIPKKPSIGKMNLSEQLTNSNYFIN